MSKKCSSLLLLLLILCAFLLAFITISNSSSSTAETSVEEIISDEKYYKVILKENRECDYYIYDVNGNIVEEESGITNLLDIKLLNDNVVDVHINEGTSLSEHHYYSIERDSFSKKYEFVMAYSNEKVAYLDGSINDRRLVVQNVFDKTEYDKEFDLNFSTFIQPVVEASFINNDSQLQITYFSGDEEVERTVILDL